MAYVKLSNGITIVEVDSADTDYFKERGWVEPKRTSNTRKKPVKDDA